MNFSTNTIMSCWCWIVLVFNRSCCWVSLQARIETLHLPPRNPTCHLPLRHSNLRDAASCGERPPHLPSSHIRCQHSLVATHLVWLQHQACGTQHGDRNHQPLDDEQLVGQPALASRHRLRSVRCHPLHLGFLPSSWVALDHRPDLPVAWAMARQLWSCLHLCRGHRERRQIAFNHRLNMIITSHSRFPQLEGCVILDKQFCKDGAFVF